VSETIERRGFLGALAATTAAWGCHAAEAAPVHSAQPPLDAWERVRAEFSLSPDWIHLAGFLLASHPKRVREAIERHRRALDDNPALYVEQLAFDPAPMLTPAAAYLGVRPEEIARAESRSAFTSSIANARRVWPG
jgi:hypothetical protein